MPASVSSSIATEIKKHAAEAEAASQRHWSLNPATEPGSNVAAAPIAREWRTRARLQHLDAWQALLQGLPHYNPDYLYDPGCEYEINWTTDPHYRVDGVRRYEYTEDGCLSPLGSLHAPLILRMLRVLCAALGHRVCREPDLYFLPTIGKDLGLTTEAGQPRYMVSPDLVVMPPSWTLAVARERTEEERIIHLDHDDPTPELVVEVLSKSTRLHDLQDKLALYAVLGIAEDLVVDPGGLQQVPSRWLFRKSNGAYTLAEDSDTPHHTFRVCGARGTQVRLTHVDQIGVPVFQWLDPNTDQWRDPAGDLRLEGHLKGQMATLINLLGKMLPGLTEQDIQYTEYHWLQNGLPDNAEDLLLEAARKPAQWRTILKIPATNELSDTNDKITGMF